MTHSRRNLAGNGPFIFEDVDIKDGVLSVFGLNLIERMNDRGVVIDTVHLNQKGFWDVVENSSEPIINSHSIPREYEDTERNITDEQIKAIARSSGC